MRDTPESRDALAVRIAAALKTPECADPTFADRVMRAVREEQGSKRRSPSRRRQTLTLGVNPLAGLAFAAGLVAIVLAETDPFSKSDRATAAPQAVAAPRDTAHIVRFVFVAPGASSVAVAGDFNHWDADAHQLLPAGADGVWSASIALTPGRHEYAFVIDGTRWAVDPASAVIISDEFGGQTSVVTVEHPERPRSG